MIPFRALILTLLLMCGGCATGLPDRGAQSPLYYDPAEVAAARRIVIVMPGAVTTAAIYAPVTEWERAGYAVVFFRLPGLDGLPLDHRFDLEAAAEQVAEFANAHQNKPVRLIGYSMGGATMMLAAGKIRHPDLKTAIIAPAPERAGGVTTRTHGALDFSLATLRADRFSRDAIWQSYFEILLHGRRASVRREKQQLIDRFMDENRDDLEAPDPLMTRAHTEDLRHWRVGVAPRLDGDRTAVFAGYEDPVFSTAQTLGLMRKFGLHRLYAYPGDGHLLLITRPEIFDHIRAFFEDRLEARPVGSR